MTLPTNSRWTPDSLPVGYSGELQGQIRDQVDRIAREMTGLPAEDQHLTEAQRLTLELGRITLLRQLPGIERYLLDDATREAVLRGATGTEVAAAAGLGGKSQAFKKWPELGRHWRARRWLRTNGERLISDASTFVALIDRMNMQATDAYSARYEARPLADERLSGDISRLRALMADKIGRWLHWAAPAEDDVEAVAVLRRLRALAEDYHTFVTTPRGGRMKE